MTLIDFVFPKLRTPETWSDKSLKSIFSDDPSTNNMVNVAKHCWNHHQCTFVLLIVHWKVNWVGKSLCYSYAKLLGLLVNTLLADEKYPLLKKDNLRLRIQMQLSQKQNFFSIFLPVILKSRWNFEHFGTKDSLINFVILQLRTPKT